MGIANFPNGFKDGIMIRGLPLAVAHPGNIYWVNNSSIIPDKGIGGSNGNDGSYLRPWSTVDYAIGMCKASRGDIIMVMPGHVEAVTSGSIALDVAGVAIVGLGEGDLRPLFNFGATSSNIAVSASNCSISNVVLKATIDQVVAGLTVSGAGVSLDIETRDTSASIEFISPIVTTATGDNIHIKWKHRGFAAGTHMTRGIDLVGCRDAVIDVDFFGKASVAVVNMRTTACDNVRVTGAFYNAAGALSYNVVNSTTSTWSVVGDDLLSGSRFYGSDSQSVIAGSASMQSLPRCLESSVSTVASGDNALFTISGGPVKILEIIGICSSTLQAQATSCKLRITTVSPAGTVDMSAAAVDLTGIAAGTSIRHINTTSILTPVTAGFVMEGNAFATQDVNFLAPAGVIYLNNASATNSGAIKWYLRYVPLSQNSRVV